MSTSRRYRVPHSAARRLVRAGSPFAHCRAYWGRGTCHCVAIGEQLHLPLDISASEEGLVMSLADLDATIEHETQHAEQASDHHIFALELLHHYGNSMRGGQTVLVRMAWDAEGRRAAASARLESLRAKREALTESAPCLG